MPQDAMASKTINVGSILVSYKNIFTNSNFLIGIIADSILMIPVISWVGLSPVLIMETLHQPKINYLIDQLVTFGGFIISSVIIQKIAGRFSFYQLIRYGCGIALCGITLSALLHSITSLFVTGMCIYAFGTGIFYGAVIRISLMVTNESTSMSSSAMSLLNCSILAIGLELSNQFCHHFKYNIGAFTSINLIVAIVGVWLVMRFAKLNIDRKWE
jgi:DHA1 family multidrug/chloramphenicol efflux transport protein-like MFS transporter